MADARDRAGELEAQMKADAQEEASRILEQARADAASERNRTLAEMREQIVSLSMAAANHLVYSGLDEKSQRAEVERFFTALPAEAATLGDGLVVVTAIPLTDKEMAAARKDLGAEDVVFETDPSILGGVIVRAEGQQIDASFASQLTTMRTSLS